MEEDFNLYFKYFFKYIVYDEFLTLDDYNYLSKLLPIARFPSDKVSLTSSKVDIVGNVLESDYLPKEKVSLFHRKYSDTLKAMQKTLCPLKSSLIEYYDYHLVVTGKNFKNLMHVDGMHKLLSVAIYLSPDINHGTFLYPEDDPLKESIEVKWKPNRAFVHSRIAKKTWHSYKGDGAHNRLVMVMNLVTSRLDEVREIEESTEFINAIKLYK